MMCDIIIPLAKKNNEILLKNIPFILSNIPHKRIFILTQKDNINFIKNKFSDKILFIDENTVSPGLSYQTIYQLLVEKKLPVRATGWYFQQFLKIGWALNPLCDSWYISWDADTIPLHPLVFFSSENKPLFTQKTEFNPAYFETINRLLELTKKNNFSFICENMTFKKSIVCEIIKKISENKIVDGKTFFEKILSAVAISSNPEKGFSEFETYGTYVTANYPELYDFRKLQTFRRAAKYTGLKPNKFDLYQLSKKYEIISIEKWAIKNYFFIIFYKLFSFFTYHLDTIFFSAK